MRLAVLASHEGTTLQALINSPVNVALVISNNSKSGALYRAKCHGIPALHISSKTHDDPDQAILDALLEHRIDVVFSAGYMKKVGPKVIEAFKGRAFNTHPSLLPKYGGEAFYGSRIYEEVIANGDTETGVCIHHIDGGYDTGKVVTTAIFPVDKNATPETLETYSKQREKHLVVAFFTSMSNKYGGGA